jgi:hypothetical protein
MSRYSGVPGVPTEGLSPGVVQLLNALKENVELVCGIRGEVDSASQCVNKSSVTVTEAPVQQMQNVTAEGSGFSIAGERVPSLDDYGRLRGDVQALASDVANIRATLNTLIAQIKG